MKRLTLLLVLLYSSLSYSQSQDTCSISVNDFIPENVICGYAPFSIAAFATTNETAKIFIDWGDGTDTTIYDIVNASTVQYYSQSSVISHSYAISGTYTATLEFRTIATNTLLVPPAHTTNYFCGLDVAGSESVQLINNYYYWENNDPPFENVALDFEDANGTTLTRYSDSTSYFWLYDSINVLAYPMTVSLNEQWSAEHHLYQITPDVHFNAPQTEDTTDWFYNYFNEHPHIMVYDSEVENVNSWISGYMMDSRIQLGFNNNFLAKPDSLLRIHLESDSPVTFDTSDLTDPVVSGNSLEFSVVYLNLHKPIYIPFAIDSANADYGIFHFDGYFLNHSDSSAIDDSLHINYNYTNPCGAFTDSVLQLSVDCGLGQCNFGPCYFLNLSKSICDEADSIFYSIELPEFLFPDTSSLSYHNATWNNNTIQGWTNIPQYQSSQNLQFFLRIDSALIQSDTNFTVHVSANAQNGSPVISECSMNQDLIDCDSLNFQLFGAYSILTAQTQSGFLEFQISDLFNCYYHDDVFVTIHFPGYVTPVTTGLPNASFTDSTLSYHGQYPLTYTHIPLQFPGSTLAGTPFEITINFSTSGDTDTTDNTAIVSGTVLNSYDPNEKITDLPVQLDPAVQDQLNYTIHFQNEGNADATNITVADTIADNLDISTFRFVGAKHHCQVFLDPNTRVVTFYFPDINLTPKSVSEDSSQSVLTYLIKELASNGIGDAFDNTAYIYFDYNDPIVTNTTHNINAALSAGSQNMENIVLYPNPAQNSISLLGDNLEHLTIFDLTGKAVLDQELTNSNSANVEKLSNGIYTCVITSKTGISQQKLVIKK